MLHRNAGIDLQHTLPRSWLRASEKNQRSYLEEMLMMAIQLDHVVGWAFAAPL